MKLFILSIVLLTSLSGFAQTAGVFPSEKIFFYDIFNDEQLCFEAQTNRGENCFQTVQFLPEGTATLMVTDIMNIGTYTINGNKVIVSIPDSVEIENLTFTLSANGKFLIEENSTKVWESQADLANVVNGNLPALLLSVE